MRTKFFRFGQLRQERGEKHVRNAELVTATNVRQTTKSGVYAKRLGFRMTSLAFSGATWGAATVSSCVQAAGGTGALMRDSLDRAWSWDGSASSPTWKYRGKNKRVWTDTTIIDDKGYDNPIPVTVEVGDNIWVFSRKVDGYSISAGQDGYYLTILNKLSGDIVYKATTAILSDGIIASCGCYDGTNVWFFWAKGTTAVYSAKFATSGPTYVPTTATYTTAGGNIQTVACFNCSAASTVLVAYGGNNGTTARLYHSSLNKTTRTAAATQLVVNSACTLPVQGLGFFGNQTSATTVYYHYYGFQNGGSGATYTGPAVVTVTVSTLAWTVSNGPGGALVGSATDAVVASGICGVDVGGGNLFDYVVYCRANGYAKIMIVQNGTMLSGGSFDATYAPLTTNQSLHGWWLASSIVYTGGYLYFLTGHDDVACSSLPTGTALLSETYSTQRVYNVHAIKATDLYGGGWSSFVFPSEIVGQFLSGQAAAQFHSASSTLLTSTSPTFNVCQIPTLIASGNYLATVVGSKVGGTSTIELSHVVVDTAKTWGKEHSANGRAVSPGGIPVCWSKSDNLHELSPLVAPSYINVHAAGTGTSYASAAAVYVIIDSDGTRWRSAPFVLSSAFGTGGTLYVPTLLHLLPGTSAYIEIYVGTTATPKLQATVMNPFNVEDFGARLFYEYTTPTSDAYRVDGEALYTVGSALSQAWPPQCQVVGTWGTRVLLGDKNVLWTSQEVSTSGFLFSEIMQSTWADCPGDINAICPVDANTCAIVGKSNVGIIDGPGPDGLGSGNYTIKTLSTEIGIAIGMPSASGDGGCYFQDSTTGRLVVVNGQGQTLECAGGARDLYSETVTAILTNESERQLHFHTSANHIIVLDYLNRTETTPMGQIYVWTPAVVAYAAAKDATGVFYVGSNGAIYRLGTTHRDQNAAGTETDYRMDIKSAQLQMEDLQGEFDVSKVQVLGKFNASCSVVLTTYPDYATSGTSTAALAVSAAPFQLATKPPNCMRVQSLQLRVAETVGTGAAFDFEGFAVEYLPRGKMKTLNTSQTVA